MIDVAQPLERESERQVFRDRPLEGAREKIAGAAQCDIRLLRKKPGEFSGARHQCISGKNLIHETQAFSLLRRNLLRGEQEIARAIEAHHDRPDDLDAIAGNDSVLKMERVSEIAILRCEDDIGKDRNFGMGGARPVDRGDHRHLDLEVILDEPHALRHAVRVHRLARSLFLSALCNAWIGPDTCVIEASSGSTAVSEAYFARMLGLRFIAVVPAATAAPKLDAIRFRKGEIYAVEDPRSVYDVAHRLAREICPFVFAFVL